MFRTRRKGTFALWFFALFAVLLSIPISLAQPTLLSSDISLRKVLEVGSGYIRLVENPATAKLYVLKSDEGLFRLTLEPAALELLTPAATFPGEATGLAFDADGLAYVVLNADTDEVFNKATVLRGVPKGETFAWETVAVTEPYPRSNTIFNHNYNGIVVSPDGEWLFVNAGSRTDHGELQDFDGRFPGLREAPLTAKIFRIPKDADNLVLPNDEAALSKEGYIFARGTRNAYDLAFAPNGDLFGTDNGPDADYPEELNWLREGRHYGFPWQFGDRDNQQQFADYDSAADKLQQPDFTAVKEGYYRNDPEFPPPPGEFTKPVVNSGPDATVYRALDGSEVDAAAAGEVLYTFTPHRSPLGLVFVDTDKVDAGAMPVKWQSNEEIQSAFVLSWGAAGGTLSDRGMDILHLSLSKSADNYEATTKQIATGFKNPIDAVLIGNKLYVLEWGSEGAVWELTFKADN